MLRRHMQTLRDIDGIGEQAVRLLNAAQIYRLDELAGEKAEPLYSKLDQRNRDQKILTQLPPLHVVAEWVGAARGLTATVTPEAEDTAAPAAGAVAEKITNVSNAQWLLLLDQAREARILEPSAASSQGNGAGEAPRKPRPGHLQSEAARLRKRGKIEARPAADSSLPDALLTPAAGAPEAHPGGAPEEEIDPRAPRGLLHPTPDLVIGGAVVTVITRLLLIAMILGTPIVLIFFSEQMLYFAAVPALLLVSALLFAIYASKLRCRVCGGHLLVSQSCLKHEKSHHVFGFGYVGSLALHALIYSWFRCIYCGTPMRLK